MPCLKTCFFTTSMALLGPWTTGVNDSSVVVALFPRSQRHLIQVDPEDETSEERGEVEQNDHD